MPRLRLALLVPTILFVACTSTPPPPNYLDAGGPVDASVVVPDTAQCAAGVLTCGKNATCLDGAPVSHCVCDEGYQGDGTTCTDVDECANGVADCSTNATCTNFPGTYTCQCNPGFVGDGRSCVPADLCQNGNGGCDSHATCAQGDGGVTCTCEPGYTGDGTTCTATGVCGSDAGLCDPHATCANQAGGGYSCTCNKGFQGNGYECSVIDQCALGTADCGPNSICTTNTMNGGYTCTCASGYALNADGVCADINECANGTADCATGAICTNFAGGYSCACPTGYSGNGVTCAPINACTSGLNDCNTNASCTSTGPGTFTCACKAGYSGDGKSCTPINACAPGGGASCSADATCSSTGPGTYKCTCNSGYKGNGQTCSPVDACASPSTNNCSANAACTSTGAGTFTCQCNAGYSGNGVTCNDVNECALGLEQCPAYSTCMNTPGSYACPCNAGFAASGNLCVDVNECVQGTANCNNASTCVNTPGGYYCACPPGNEGGADCAPLNKTVSAGDTYGCFIGAGSSLYCWGTSFNSALGISGAMEEVVPTLVSGSWKTVSSDASHTCAVGTNGGLYCWGVMDASNTTYATPTSIGGTSWADVAVGNKFTCALKTNGTLWCWGSNNVGQLGDATLNSTTSPHQIGTATTWEVITAGDHHACGLQAGQLFCWGGNEDGQVGVGGGLGVVSTPTAIGAASDWATVRAGSAHTCALEETSDTTPSPSLALWCWGNNASGQLGTGAVTAGAGPQLIPIPGGATAQSWSVIAPGFSHTCGVLSDNSLWCWGDNAFGELGDGTTTPQTTPEAIPTGNDWVALAAGTDFTCGAHMGGTTSCWGSNDGARLGLGVDASSNVPVSTGNKTWAQLSAGGSSACAIASNDESLWCWGQNGSGQVGVGSTAAQRSAVEVLPAASASWSSVAVGTSHACAVRTDDAGSGTGTLWCWGDNTYGQLGTSPSTTPTLSPQQIGSSVNWISVSAGAYHTCALAEGASFGQSTLWCWGRNDSGQVGVGPAGKSSPMIQIITSNNTKTWTAVAAGDAHTCAIDASVSQNLWCWGDNTNGQLGIGSSGSNNSKTAPTLVSTAISAWNTIFLGTQVSCGVASSGNTLACWGLNQYGQLGQGTSTNATVPGVVAIPTPGGSWAYDQFTGSAASGQVCARESDDSLWCWGQDVRGDLGNGMNATNASLPSRVGAGNSWSAVAAGLDFTCGIGQNSQIWCFGLNNQGQYGNGKSWVPTPAQQP
jgi:alpha-tubulin suppressor-like RCC1 family protein